MVKFCRPFGISKLPNLGSDLLKNYFAKYSNTSMQVTLISYLLFATNKSLAQNTLPVEFASARPVLAVQDKTPEDFGSLNPSKRIIECSIRLSATANLDEAVIDRLEYEFQVPEDCIIVDYLPKTTIGSEVAAINLESNNATNQMRIRAIEGGASVGFAFPIAKIEGSVAKRNSDSLENSIASGVRMDVLPPKLLVTAASTFKDGKALRIKLQQRSQITLQGDKDYVLLMETPANFECGFIEVSCSAHFRDSKVAPVGARREIKLFLSGKDNARERKPKDWVAFNPKTYSILGQSEVTAAPKKAEKVVGVETFDGIWKYQAKSPLGSFSGKVEIKRGLVKLLDGTASYLGISFTITGDSKIGFKIEDDRSKVELDLVIKKDRMELKFPSELWTFTPFRVDHSAEFEALTK